MKLSLGMVPRKHCCLIEELTFCRNSLRKFVRFSRFARLNTSSYHPSTNVERFNSSLCKSISMYVAKDQKDWCELIPLILFAHRTSISEAIGDSPFYVLFGREPRLPIDIKYLPEMSDDVTTSVSEYRKRIVEKVELAQTLARDNLHRSKRPKF